MARRVEVTPRTVQKGDARISASGQVDWIAKKNAHEIEGGRWQVPVTYPRTGMRDTDGIVEWTSGEVETFEVMR